VKRREFIMLVGGAAVAWPLGGQAQQSNILPVIGLLGAAVPDDAEVARNLTAFRRGLAEAGYLEGKNVQIEYRWAEGHYERLPALAAELVSRHVDVIVNEGGAPSVFAAKSATSTIPIVFHVGVDPVASGLVASLAHPGGNLTGVSVLTVELLPKALQFLSELVPKARRIALLINPANEGAEPMLRGLRGAAKDDATQFRALNAGSEAEINAAFSVLGHDLGDALIVGSDPLYTTRREQIVALAARHAIPTIYQQALFPRAGGLISYGPSLPTAYRLKGHYTGKILGGAKPDDLPVQQPTTLELVINLKTAKALGLEVPLIMQQLADEVIE
jgi:putative tryptophan/tyrosine transport system substrate-binding protein